MGGEGGGSGVTCVLLVALQADVSGGRNCSSGRTERKGGRKELQVLEAASGLRVPALSSDGVPRLGVRRCGLVSILT